MKLEIIWNFLVNLVIILLLFFEVLFDNILKRLVIV